MGRQREVHKKCKGFELDRKAATDGADIMRLHETIG
jgi:hypothetical protein